MNIQYIKFIILIFDDLFFWIPRSEITGAEWAHFYGL